MEINLFRKNIFVFFVSLAIIIGTSYQLYIHLDYTKIPDSWNYLKLADGDFNVAITHRYRVVIPFSAKFLSIPLEESLNFIWPHRADHQWALRFSFLVINTSLLAITSVIIFKICLLYGSSVFAAFIGIIAILVSRWTGIFTSIPWTDSLYLFTIALSIYGIKARSNMAIISSIIIGPFAKESFIFFAPVIFFFAYKQVGLVKLSAWFVLSGILVFTFRSLIDSYMEEPPVNSLRNAFDHFNNFPLLVDRLAGLRGIGEVLSVWGLFSAVIVSGFLGGKAGREAWLKKTDYLVLFTCLSIIVHAIVSIEVGRMLYFASPMVAVCIALIIDNHYLYSNLKDWISQTDTTNSADE